MLLTHCPADGSTIQTLAPNPPSLVAYTATIMPLDPPAAHNKCIHHRQCWPVFMCGENNHASIAGVTRNVLHGTLPMYNGAATKLPYTEKGPSGTHTHAHSHTNTRTHGKPPGRVFFVSAPCGKTTHKRCREKKRVQRFSAVVPVCSPLGKRFTLRTLCSVRVRLCCLPDANCRPLRWRCSIGPHRNEPRAVRVQHVGTMRRHENQRTSQAANGELLQ